MNDRLSYEEKKELPDSVFGLPERREYPMPDAAHVRAAEAYFRYCPDDLKPKLAKATWKALSCSHMPTSKHAHAYPRDGRPCGQPEMRPDCPQSIKFTKFGVILTK